MPILFINVPLVSNYYRKRLPALLLSPIMVILLTVCLVFPFLYIGLFNFPSSDDFINSFWHNYSQKQAALYHTWSGRYFANALVTLNPIHWHSFVGYRIAGISLILLFCFAIMLLVFRALSAYTRAPVLICCILSSATVILLLNNITALYECFYWYTASTTYTISEILFAFLIGIAIRLDRAKESRPRIGHYLVSTLLLAACIGSNELIMVLCLLVSLGLYFHYRRARNARLTQFYLWLLVVCVLCASIEIFAPGNFARSAIISRSTQTALSTWIYYSSTLLRDWIFDPFLLLYSALFLLFSNRFKYSKTRSSLLLTFFFPVSIVFLLTFPGIWIMGTTPPGRVVNLVYLFFILSWIYFLLNVSNYVRDIFGGTSREIRAARQIILVLLLIGIMASFTMARLRNSNYFYIAKSLSQRIPQNFCKDMTARYAIIMGSKSDTVIVPPIPRNHLPGNLLYYTDLGTNPYTFPNPDIARYWGKAQIYVSADSTQPSIKTR